MERVMGIEPTRSAWKADVLPLNYTREATNHARTRGMQAGGSGARLRPRPCNAPRPPSHPRKPETGIASKKEGGGERRIRTAEG